MTKTNMDFSELDLELVQTPLLVSPQNFAADIFVTWGDGYWPDMIAERLVDVATAPVASAALLDRFGTPKGPSDLLYFPLIHQRDTVGWQAWFKHHGVTPESPLTGPMIEDTNAVL